MFTIITNYKKLFLLTLRSEFAGGENPDSDPIVALGNRPKDINETTIDESLKEMKKSGTFDIRLLKKIKDQYELEKSKLNTNAQKEISDLLKLVNNIIFNNAKEYYRGLGKTRTINLKKELNLVLGDQKLDIKSSNISLKEYNTIVEFQRKNDIQIDGIIGTGTIKKINELKKAPVIVPVKAEAIEKKSSEEKIRDTINENEKNLKEQIDGMKKIILDYLKDNKYENVNLNKLSDNDIKDINEIIIKIQSKQKNENELKVEFEGLGITLLKNDEEVDEVKVEEALKQEETVDKPKLSSEKAEKSYNEKLDKALDPNNHIFLDLGDGNVFVIGGNKEEREGILLLAKSLKSNDTKDKLPVATIEYLVREYTNAGKIKTITEVYSSIEGNGNQAIIKKGGDSDKVLLNAYLEEKNIKDIETIKVGKGSKLANAILNTFTFGLGNIDTASTSSDKVKKGTNGIKAKSADFYNGYLSGNENIKPLSRFENNKILGILAKEVENVLDDGIVDEKEDKTKAGKMALEYIKTIKNAPNVISVPKNLIKEKEIKRWLEKQENILPQNEGVTISEKGFITFNEEELKKGNDYIKVGLKGVEGKDKDGKKLINDKDVYLEKTFIGFDEVGLNFGKEGMPDVKIKPIILEKDGKMMQITKDGIYVVGEGVKNGKDKTIDFIKNNDVVIAGILGGIIGACIVKGINIPEINLSWIKMPKIDISAESFKEELARFFEKLKVDKIISAAALSYLMTSIPLQYKIEGLEEKLSDERAQFKSGPAVIGEIEGLKGINENDIKKLIETHTGEGKNKIIHKILVAKNVFKVGEATGLFFNYKKSGEGYNITTIGKGEESKILINGIEYYIPEGEKISIKLDKNLDIISKDGKLKEKRETMGMDLFAKDFNTTLQDVLNKTNVEKKSVEK